MKFRLVPKVGIEPTRYYLPQDFKSCASTYSATQAKNGVPEMNRTSDPLIKSQLLYRLSYGDLFMVPTIGIEPTTY